MRKFRVGDRVRWGVNKDGEPVWDGVERIHVHTDGHVVGTVDAVDSGAELFRADMWWWPQPSNMYARYGEPGYLELVRAVDHDEASLTGLAVQLVTEDGREIIGEVTADERVGARRVLVVIGGEDD